MLKVPLHFVAPPYAIWPEIRQNRLDEIDDARLSELSVGSGNGWVTRTYYHFKMVGESVSLSSDPRPNAVNIVAPRDFGRRKRSFSAFVLVPRADGHYPMLANFWVNQNRILDDAETHWNIPYWPQAHIRPRRQERSVGIERISFKGRFVNLDRSFQDDSFMQLLAKRGIEFELDAFDELVGAHSWGDYRNVDAVLAVRNMTRTDARNKPASKLINAWFGEVPAILGPEPAFRALRQSDYDYIEVKTVNEALHAIDELRKNHELYTRMVENGRRRRREFTVESVLARWVEVLNGPVWERFQRWQRQGAARHAAWIASRMVLEPFSKKYYRYRVRHGRRILDDC